MIRNAVRRWNRRPSCSRTLRLGTKLPRYLLASSVSQAIDLTDMPHSLLADDLLQHPPMPN
jgi:hypothetical protein